MHTCIVLNICNCKCVVAMYTTKLKGQMQGNTVVELKMWKNATLVSETSNKC